MTEHSYPVVISPLSDDEGGGFMAYVPDLQGCLSDGATYEEAAANVALAIGEWIDEAERLKRPVPKPYSAWEDADRERQEMISVIRKQAKVMAAQEKQVAELRGHVDALLALEPAHKPAWPHRVVMASATRKATKRPRGDGKRQH